MLHMLITPLTSAGILIILFIHFHNNYNELLQKEKGSYKTVYVAIHKQP